MPNYGKETISGNKRKTLDRRQKSKYESGYEGTERRICNRRVKDRAKDLRRQIKRDRERNKIAYTLKLRELYKKRNNFLSEERCFIKEQKKIVEILNTQKLSDADRNRLSREIALLYKLNLHTPAKEQILSWRKENTDYLEPKIDKNQSIQNQTHNYLKKEK